LSLPRVRRGGALVAGGGLLLLVAASLAARVQHSLAAGTTVGTIVAAKATFVREVVAEGVLKAVRATPILAPMEQSRAQKIAYVAKDGAAVKAGEVVVRFDPLEAEREAKDGRDDLRSAQGKIERARAEDGKTRNGLSLEQKLAQQELDRARTFELKDAELYSRHQIVESTLDRTLQESKATSADQRFEVSGKLGAAGVALGAIEADKAALRLQQAEKSLRGLTVAAPHDGFFVLQRGWMGETAHVGATLWPGQKVADIPDLSELEARVHALEADAAGLRPGLLCRVLIEGRPGEVHAAKVAAVQPVARPRDRGSPVKFFETTVSLDHTDASFMKPGQRVLAHIALEEIKEVLAVPRGALFEKDGQRILYVRRGGRFVPVEVQVGPNSVSKVVITAGLSPGEEVALRDPSEGGARALARREGQAEATR
jgi:multidrug efflux pump subunit AcrA (membrane-fusion protein)